MSIVVIGLILVASLGFAVHGEYPQSIISLLCVFLLLYLEKTTDWR